MAEHRYEILLTPGARRDLAGLPIATQRQIARAIDGLVVNPRPPGCRLLAGSPSERIWRLRVGEHRVLYEIRDSRLLVLVIRIAHRHPTWAQLVASGRLTPPANPDTRPMPPRRPPTTGITATEALIAERRVDER